MAPSPIKRALNAALALTVALASSPALALETLKVRLGLINTDFIIQLDELLNTASLWRGESDMAELDRATGGALGRRVLEMFHTPLAPTSSIQGVVNHTVGSPLLSQALLMVSAVVRVENMTLDREGHDLVVTLETIQASGKPVTLLSLLQAIPGRTARIDLAEALYVFRRTKRQTYLARNFLASHPPITEDAALVQPGGAGVERTVFSLDAPHRPDPISMVLLRPASASEVNNRLVVISHGLWDSTESFEGWGWHLASHGYSVVLPVHPGSDFNQQQAMLSGQMPPPDPDELRFRPLDVKALLAALNQKQVPAMESVDSNQVVVVGHSWGATTALQLGGLKTSSSQLGQRCDDVRDPARNMSWLLQCSFLSSADQASLADKRVIAVVAVSPPLALLFPPGSGAAMNARGLLVSGSADWVVPPDPEAVIPMREQQEDKGHRLVLARGGNHFNLRPGAKYGGVLGGVILAWVEGAFSAGEEARPTSNPRSLLPVQGWGNSRIPLIDATSIMGGS